MLPGALRCKKLEGAAPVGAVVPSEEITALTEQRPPFFSCEIIIYAKTAKNCCTAR